MGDWHSPFEATNNITATAIRQQIGPNHTTRTNNPIKRQSDAQPRKRFFVGGCKWMYSFGDFELLDMEIRGNREYVFSHSISRSTSLQNLSTDVSQEYFADGMTDELITTLGTLNGLRVISRTSVMVYAGHCLKSPASWASMLLWKALFFDPATGFASLHS